MKVDPISTQDLKTADQVAPQFTNEQKRDELAREINLRQVVYPGQIRAGKLTQERADRQLGILSSIWAEFRDRATADRAKIQPSLALDESAPQEQHGSQPQPNADGAANPEQEESVEPKYPPQPPEQQSDQNSEPKTSGQG